MNVAAGADNNEPQTLFDAEFLSKLDQLELLGKRLLRGLYRGEHSTPRRGKGLEFADFRRYRPGDDLRYIDWNIFARLDRLFLKLFSSDEDLTLHLLIDTSASMNFGYPLKFDYARKLAAALAYVGLSNLDKVAVTAFNEALHKPQPVLKTKRQMARLLNHLEELQSRSTTDLARSFHTFAARHQVPGLVVVISDLMSDSVVPGLDMLRHRGHQLMVVQLLSEEEIQPPLDGSLTLVDAEDGSELKVSVDAELRALYQERLNAALGEMESYCRRAGMEYLRASTAVPFEDVVLKYLRQGSFWR